MTTKIETNVLLETLRDYPHWIVYRLEPTKDGKITKTPYNPRTGRLAKTDKPQTWTDYETARLALDKGKYAGLGWVFTKDAGIVGIDIDHCLNGGKIADPAAAETVARMDSYTEVSPSGDGLHIWCRGTLGRSFGSVDYSPFEAYESGRYFTITGEVFTGPTETIEDRQAELDTFKQQELQRRRKATAPAERPAAAPATNQVDSIAATLGRLHRSRADSYDEWIKVGFALQSELGDAGFPHWEKWSQQSSKFEPGACEKHWKSFDPGEGITWGTVVHWASEDNPLPKSNGSSYTPPPGSILDLTTGEVTEVAPPTGSTWADLAGVIGPIEWAWPGWLPLGFQVLIAGISGDGKSILTLRTAASYLRGWDWPDGTPFAGELGKVLWCETEAAQALNLERARAWDLPLDNILSPLDNPLEDVSLDNPAHRCAVAAAAARDDVKLIIIDSLSGSTRKDLKGSSDSLDIGRWIAELARDSGKPVLVVHHTRKKGLLDGDLINLDRLRDSSAIVQTARVVWAIDTPDFQTPDQKRLYVIKSNLGKFPEPVGFEIDDNGKIVFLDFVPEAPHEPSPLEMAVEMLKSELKRGAVASTDIEAAAQGLGISMPTVNRAKKRMGIVSKKIGSTWLWSLPSKD